MCVRHSLNNTPPVRDWIIPRASHFIPLLAASCLDFVSYCAWHCWWAWWLWQFHVSATAFLFAGGLKLPNDIRLISPSGAISDIAENTQTKATTGLPSQIYLLSTASFLNSRCDEAGNEQWGEELQRGRVGGSLLSVAAIVRSPKRLCSHSYCTNWWLTEFSFDKFE